MVCPYCETRNAPNSVICSSCGIILKDAKARMRPEKRLSPRDILATILIFCMLGVLIGIAGMYVGKEIEDSGTIAQMHRGEMLGFQIGFVFGILLVLFVTTGRFLMLNFRYRQRANKYASEVKHRSVKIDKLLEQLTKEKPAQAHLMRGLAELMHDEIETSVQQFEQAQRLGLVTVELVNAQGVALARRGMVDAAVDRFNRIVAQQPREVIPESTLRMRSCKLATRPTPRRRWALSMKRASFQNRTNT